MGSVLVRWSTQNLGPLSAIDLPILRQTIASKGRGEKETEKKN
jgi:hypothetical protein